MTACKLMIRHECTKKGIEFVSCVSAGVRYGKFMKQIIGTLIKTWGTLQMLQT